MDKKEIKRINKEIAEQMKKLGVTQKEISAISQDYKNEAEKSSQNALPALPKSKCYASVDGKVWMAEFDQIFYYHRSDGPAVERDDGTKKWYWKGHLHRIDGPAVIHPNGEEEYWIDDIEYSKEEFLKFRAKPKR